MKVIFEKNRFFLPKKNKKGDGKTTIFFFNQLKIKALQNNLSIPNLEINFIL